MEVEGKALVVGSIRFCEGISIIDYCDRVHVSISHFISLCLAQLYIFDKGSPTTNAAVQSHPLSRVRNESTRSVFPSASPIVLPVPYPFASSQRELFVRGGLFTPHLVAPDLSTFASFKWEDRESAFIHFWSARATGQILDATFTTQLNKMAVVASGTYVLLHARGGATHPRP
ncbi:hypothetical protein B0H13DRAFT_2352290 [Mycena leptocephala]|nr:hypothetical protein B0H13DRAFT_2352290 [Mycena leptocephala]